MTSPNAHPSPILEATGCSPHSLWCYGRDPSIVQPTVFYYRAPLAGLGHLETNEPWSLSSAQHSKALGSNLQVREAGAGMRMDLQAQKRGPCPALRSASVVSRFQADFQWEAALRGHFYQQRVVGWGWG